jgi:hypothetical protein
MLTRISCQMVHLGPLVQSSLLPHDESCVPHCLPNSHFLHVHHCHVRPVCSDWLDSLPTVQSFFLLNHSTLGSHPKDFLASLTNSQLKQFKLSSINSSSVFVICFALFSVSKCLLWEACHEHFSTTITTLKRCILSVLTSVR